MNRNILWGILGENSHNNLLRNRIDWKWPLSQSIFTGFFFSLWYINYNQGTDEDDMKKSNNFKPRSDPLIIQTGTHQTRATVLLFVPYLPIPKKLFTSTPDPCRCYDVTSLDFDLFASFTSVSRFSQHRESLVKTSLKSCKNLPVQHLKCQVTHSRS